MGGLAKGLAIIEAFAAHDVMSVADAARLLLAMLAEDAAKLPGASG